MSETKINLGTGSRGPRGHDGPTGPTGSAGTGGLTGPTGAAVIAPLIAAAEVNSDGTFISEKGFSASAQTGTGQYTSTLTNPPANLNNLSVVITISGNIGGQVSYLVAVGGVIEVFTFNAAGAAANKIFAIAVFDLT